MSKIVSIATGVPPFRHKQEDIFLFADIIHSQNEQESRKLKFLYNHSGISTRHSIIPDYSLPLPERIFYPKTADLEPFPSLEKRMQWFAEHAVPLSVDTIRHCIDGKINAEDITHLITVTCTGLSAPGLDLEIVEKMHLSPAVYRTSVNFMGCYAAIHALKLADSICKNDTTANVVIVCTELCTLHFQKENSIDNITAALLFSDGCAAVLLQHSASSLKGMQLNKFYAEVSFKGKKDMSWQLSSKGFLMTLTGYVPALLEEDFDQLVGRALTSTGLLKEEINYWCIHPGGKKILEAIQKSTGICCSYFRQAYEVLNNYGNMSSPTILFVLKKIFDELEQDPLPRKKNIFGAAFGPGLTMETFTASYG
ncbi:MAG: type III polyketide synthase [Ferruginibacter sp.]